MKITVLGSGTSQGVPVIACGCPVCTSTDTRDTRLRSSIWVQTETDGSWVIDTGPDFRQQMLRQNVKQLDAVLLTHLHKDHIAGLDDVRAFNFKDKRPMDVYADARTIRQLHMEFPYVFDGTNYPGIPQLNVIEMADVPFFIQNQEVVPVLVYHHKLPVWGFRLNDFAYVTDASSIPPESMDKLQGLRVLILNALRKESHIAHFNLEQALEVIEILKPQQAYLTHISHLLGRHAEVEATLPPQVRIAFDGLTLEA